MKTDPTMPTSEERNVAMLAHVLQFVGGFIAPLVIWIVYKDKSAFIADQAKEALNFQITLFIASVVLMISLVGLLVLPILIIAAMVYYVVAAMEANKGVYFRYPYILRLVN
jgi:uncharacterized Tic20 family protein